MIRAVPAVPLMNPIVRCPSDCSTAVEQMWDSAILLGGSVKGAFMAANEKTGKKAGAAASKVLKDGRTGTDSKTAAGSALSQRPDKKK